MTKIWVTVKNGGNFNLCVLGVQRAMVVFTQVAKLKQSLKTSGVLLLQCSSNQISCIEKLFLSGIKLHGLGRQFLHVALYEYTCDGRRQYPDFSSFFMIGFKDEEPNWLQTGTQVHSSVCPVIIPQHQLFLQCSNFFPVQLQPPPPANKFVCGNIYPNSVPHIANISAASKKIAVYTKKGSTPIHPVNNATALEVFQEFLDRYIPIVDDDFVLDLNAHSGKLFH